MRFASASSRLSIFWFSAPSCAVLLIPVCWAYASVSFLASSAFNFDWSMFTCIYVSLLLWLSYAPGNGFISLAVTFLFSGPSSVAGVAMLLGLDLIGLPPLAYPAYFNSAYFNCSIDLSYSRFYFSSRSLSAASCLSLNASTFLSSYACSSAALRSARRLASACFKSALR